MAIRALLAVNSLIIINILILIVLSSNAKMVEIGTMQLTSRMAVPGIIAVPTKMAMIFLKRAEIALLTHTTIDLDDMI